MSAQTGSGPRPPVVLVDGYHLFCDSSFSTSTGDFANMEQYLRAEGVQVYFFGTCSIGGKPRIEKLGIALGQLIDSIGAPKVDLVTFSMGGLVARSYLAGQQPTDTVAQPAFTTPPLRVRKFVAIASPNFGALFPGSLSFFAPDSEVTELIPGSRYLFDLATWNNNHDDLHEVDALAIIGNNGGVFGGPNIDHTSDGLVTVTSASLLFATPDERTRIIPYCHTDNPLYIVFSGGCTGLPIAKIRATDHLAWQIVDSFLSDTPAWRTLGHTPSQDPVLSKYGGTETEPRNASDVQSGDIQERDLITNTTPGTFTSTITKPGPAIALVVPSAGRVASIEVAPRMIVSIYGKSLSGGTVTMNGTALTVFYAGDNQINALLPETTAVVAPLTVTAASGKSSVNLVFASAVPAVYTLDSSGTGPAAIIRTSNVISLFLTGLGFTTTPTVKIAGIPTTINYAGPAPGYPGLDQINFVIPAADANGVPLPLGVALPVVVEAGGHTSNTTTVTL
ncbi:MAG: hypothetical protein M3O35_16915 [Acidobacteriota bacterium]|nr:hypothetical protein [Acidobacteriota bacterium]